MNKTYLDILNQPKVLKKALSAYESYFEELQDYKKHMGRTIVFLGMGASLFANNAAALALNKMGISAFSLDASEVLYESYAGLKKDWLYFITSQSGESVEIKGLVDKMLSDGFEVIGITNNPESYMGKKLDKVLLLCSTTDNSVAVNTYTSSLMLLLLIADGISGKQLSLRKKEFEEAIEKIKEFSLEGEDRVAEALKLVASAKYIVLAGRGLSYSSAVEGALLMKEGCKCYSEGMTGGGFRHGAVEIIDEDHCSVIFTYSKNCELPLNLARQALSYKGKVIMVADKVLMESENLVTITTGHTSEYGAFLGEIVPLQFMTIALAKHKGIEIGEFRNTVPVITCE